MTMGIADTARAERYGQAALERQCADLASAFNDRNRRLNAAAYGLGQLVGSGYLDYAAVENGLFSAAMVNGYVAKDGAPAARATIRSGLRSGALRPRDIPDREPCHRTRLRPDPAEARRQQAARRRAEESARADAARRKRLALQIWAAGQDPRGTIADTRYLRSRALILPDEAAGAALRYVESCPWGEGQTVPALVGLMRDARTGEPKAIQRIGLTPAGEKLDRKMLADAYGCAVMLDAYEEVATGLAAGEGIESCLAARQFGIRPVWAMCSTSMVAHLPVLAGVESLTLLVENDENGASDRACTKTATRWHEAGRAVDFVRPDNRSHKDLNDVLKGGAAS